MVSWLVILFELQSGDYCFFFTIILEDKIFYIPSFHSGLNLRKGESKQNFWHPSNSAAP
jgi:hypothetical protein